MNFALSWKWLRPPNVQVAAVWSAADTGYEVDRRIERRNRYAARTTKDGSGAPPAVPALTSNRSINLNKRISLLSTSEPIACGRWTLPCPAQHGEVAGRGHTLPLHAR